jgi:oligopeptide transport system substrate-binding protein
LAEIGIQVSLMRLAWAQHLETIENGKTSFFRLGWVCDYPDGENLLTLFDNRAFSPAGNNFFRYSNPEFQRLYEEAVSQTDPGQALLLYRQAQNVVLEDAPLLLLYHNERVHLLQPYVRGFKAQGLSLRQAKYVWLDQPAAGDAS